MNPPALHKWKDIHGRLTPESPLVSDPSEEVLAERKKQTNKQRSHEHSPFNYTLKSKGSFCVIPLASYIYYIQIYIHYFLHTSEMREHSFTTSTPCNPSPRRTNPAGSPLGPRPSPQENLLAGWVNPPRQGPQSCDLPYPPSWSGDSLLLGDKGGWGWVQHANTK